ncbi:kh domain containing protein [Stylonychia lemnae]|uniref:Kh domain containing protein n=1 Tax=Stylonychia lemnae TaxID=5949 RepID=A0A078B3H3_STYLE|nr:kh domain containing protein [Stylonychia lemnae]|eukprot:CDW89080.1 kh domain containing protein [Stylonychia lemnae]
MPRDKIQRSRSREQPQYYQPQVQHHNLQQQQQSQYPQVHTQFNGNQQMINGQSINSNYKQCIKQASRKYSPDNTNNFSEDKRYHSSSHNHHQSFSKRFDFYQVYSKFDKHHNNSGYTQNQHKSKGKGGFTRHRSQSSSQSRYRSPRSRSSETSGDYKKYKSRRAQDSKYAFKSKHHEHKSYGSTAYLAKKYSSKRNKSFHDSQLKPYKKRYDRSRGRSFDSSRRTSPTKKTFNFRKQSINNHNDEKHKLAWISSISKVQEQKPLTVSFQNKNTVTSNFETFERDQLCSNTDGFQNQKPIEMPKFKISPIEKTGSISKYQIPGLTQTFISTQPDGQKYKQKIYMPRNTGINYVGLLIGPKGIYQKRLQEQTDCKILIRGRGSHKDGHPMQQNDVDDQHVLIIGDTEEKAQNAAKVVYRVLTADEETRNAIRQEQLYAAQEMSKDLYKHPIDDYLLTPYGPPSPYALIIPVPNECVGLIIGKGGETIRYLQMKSGSKIQVAKKEIPNSTMRNVFIEGQPEKFDGAKALIENIVNEHRKMQESFSLKGEVNPFPGPYTNFAISNAIIDIIIGQNGQTIKSLHQKTGCYIFIPQEVNSSNERVLQLSGPLESIEKCKIELLQIIRNVQNFADSTGQKLDNHIQKASFLQQNEFQKKSLLEQAMKDQQLLLPKSHNFYSSDIKDENPVEDPSKSGNVFNQISQKDFLFDPLAAAYYERFTLFTQGSSLNFNELKWPALAKSRLENSNKNYKTYYEEYCTQYGIQCNLNSLDFEQSLLSESTNLSTSTANSNNQQQSQSQSVNVNKNMQASQDCYNKIIGSCAPNEIIPQQVNVTQTNDNQQQQQHQQQYICKQYNQMQLPIYSQSQCFTGDQIQYVTYSQQPYDGWSGMPVQSQMNTSGYGLGPSSQSQYLSQDQYFSNGAIYHHQLSQQSHLQPQAQLQQYSSQQIQQQQQQKQSAVSLFYKCFGPDGTISRQIPQSSQGYITDQEQGVYQLNNFNSHQSTYDQTLDQMSSYPADSTMCVGYREDLMIDEESNDEINICHDEDEEYQQFSQDVQLQDYPQDNDAVELIIEQD